MSGPQGRGRAGRIAAVQTATAGHRVDQRDLQGTARPGALPRPHPRWRDRPRAPADPRDDRRHLAQPPHRLVRHAFTHCLRSLNRQPSVYSAAGAGARRGRVTSSPLQLGHVSCMASLQDTQNVHSYEQIRADEACDSTVSHRSQRSRISSAMTLLTSFKYPLPGCWHRTKSNAHSRHMDRDLKVPAGRCAGGRGVPPRRDTADQRQRPRPARPIQPE